MNMSRIVRSLVCVVVAFLWLEAAPSLAVTFTDTDFNNGDWTATKIVDTTPGNGASFTATQMTSGGNPSSFREVIHSYNSGAITVAHLNNAALYNPTTAGALSAVDFTYDIIRINPSTNAPLVGYAGLAFQNGSYYQAPADTLGTATWTSFSHAGLLPSNFTLVGGAGPAAPDLSATGSPIRFGYITFNAAPVGSGAITTDSGIDNWRVNTSSTSTPGTGGTPGGLSAVPEPSTWLLLSSGLTGLAAWRKIRRIGC